jgi:hypothetical protein
MGWLKDVFDILKDTFEVGSKATDVKRNELEIRRATLEVNKLEIEKVKPLIHLASFEQIERYDEKTRKIRRKANGYNIFLSYRHAPLAPRKGFRLLAPWWAVWGFVLVVGLILLFFLFRR